MSSRVIGTFSLVDFPEFGTERVAAKIDTGAYTGALHCLSIEEREAEGGTVLCFVPHGSVNIIQRDNFAVKHVKSSNGKRETRYFITTVIVIQKQSFEITLSLTDRSEMRWPVLIGRRFLRQYKFLIDPSLSSGYRVQASSPSKFETEKK